MSIPTRKYTFRKLVHDLHLWLGLPSAVILFVMCFTGTMYVFQTEISRWIDRDKFYVSVPAQAKRLPIDLLKSRVEKQLNGQVATIQIPQEPEEAWLFATTTSPGSKDKSAPLGETKKKRNEKEKTGKADAKEKAKGYLVDPYTGTVLGNAKTPSATFFATVLQVHRWLLIDNHDIGGAITGTACLMMLFLQLSGFILWLPAKWASWKKWTAWKPGFLVSGSRNAKRLNFDLHKTLGFYAFGFVTIMALTGPYFAFSWYKEGAQKLLNAKPIPKENTIQSAVQPAQPLPLDDILAKVNQVYPYSGATRLTLPNDTTGSVAVQKVHQGFFSSAAIDRVTLDQYTAAVLDKLPYTELTLGGQIINSTKAIHTGELFGTFSKFLYFLACLLATSLPITGISIWWSKFKKNKPRPNAGKNRAKGEASQNEIASAETSGKTFAINRAIQGTQRQ